MKTHVVSVGENLWRIANKYGVSVMELTEANRLNNPNNLEAGQELVIPTAKDVHIVRPGETLWIIARKHGVSMRELINENRLANLDMVYPGTALRIPKKSMDV